MGGRRAWTTAAELEEAADGAVAELRALRVELARTRRERACAWVDRRVRTDATEYLDRPDYPEERKLRQVRLLHGQNRALGVYGRYLAILDATLRDAAAARADGRARVLELASGSGELALELAQLAARRGTPMAITGSDVVEAYVRDGNRRARELGIDAAFRLLDAFELEGVEHGEIDVAFIAQSMHHFTPGQLARMIAKVGALGARHFIGIDGFRSLLGVAVLPLLAAVTLDRHHFHDALVSARRMYAEEELRLIAELAAPAARVDVVFSEPAMTVVSVRYAAGEGA